MKNYYSILEVKESSSQDDIKKSYRILSKRYHPDLNNDPLAEDKFKEISEAYQILSDPIKRRNYDASRGNTRFNSNFKSDFGYSEFTGGGFYNSRRQRDRSKAQDFKTSPSTEYLNILDSITLDLTDAIKGKQVTFSYKKQLVSDFETGSKETVDKTLKVTINLKDKHIPILKEDNNYFLNITLKGFGNEDLRRRLNTWGESEIEFLEGDYVLKVRLTIPDNIEILDNNIIQYVNVPLYKTMFKDEKVRVTTIFEKTYDAEINNPSKLNDLKITLKSNGIKSKSNNIGDYVIKFNIILPDLNKLKSKDIDHLKQYLTQDLY